MRLATYNVEWFGSLFDTQNKLLMDDDWSRRYNVTRRQQITALGEVFRAVDADAVMVIEAPDASPRKSTELALKDFANHFGLRQSEVLIGFANDTQQEIALMYDPARLEASHDPQGGETGATPQFDKKYKIDLDIDARPEAVRFSKPPLEVALLAGDDPPIRLIGVHAKSKAPHGARNRKQEVRISIANRRKQLAQCIWLRQRVDEVLATGDTVVVLGDFNDGPGLDEYEKLFGQSGVEIVLGPDKPAAERLYDPHATALIAPRPGPMPATARFYNSRDKRYMNALLDYIMVSDDIRRQASPTWKIWHPFDDPDCFECVPLRDALLLASDHFPVTIDFNISALA
jgi:Endonuclease/Exonuclease/phosphatase family